MSQPSQPSVEDIQAEDLAHDLASDLPSPYCPGRSIASCPSQAARELEDDILVLAKQGKERKEIESILVARFGEEKMGQSQQSEVLVAIVLGAVLALVAIVWAARRWLRPLGPRPAGSATDASLDGISRAELDRLEDELDNLDEL